MEGDEVEVEMDEDGEEGEGEAESVKSLDGGMVTGLSPVREAHEDVTDLDNLGGGHEEEDAEFERV